MSAGLDTRGTRAAMTTTFTAPAGERYTLWGGALSLYTGKVRSYLIKAGIPYREFYISHPEYRQRIWPAIRLVVAPVLETPDGEIVQDSTDIIECLEARHPASSMIPATPLQRAVASLIDAYGCEGLLAAAMHYRWSYRDQQSLWLLDEFGRFAASGGRQVRHEAAARFMDRFGSMLEPLGVTAATAPAIEASYRTLLAILDEHFLAHPYLLGGRPSIAYFGLLPPMYAHLGRDPVPSQIRKLTAPNVDLWTERMNLVGVADPEFAGTPDAWLPDDAIPETLRPLLRHIFDDWGPELLASAAHYDAWVRAHPGLPSGSPPSSTPDHRLVHPMLGPISFPYHGVTMTRLCAPQSLWHFGKAATELRAFDAATRTRWRALLPEGPAGDVLSIELALPLRRHDNLLVVD